MIMPLRFRLGCTKRQVSKKEIKRSSTQKISQLPDDDNLKKNGQTGSNGCLNIVHCDAKSSSRTRQRQVSENLENNAITSSDEVICKIEKPIPSMEAKARSLATDWISLNIDLRNGMNDEDAEKLNFLSGSYLTINERREPLLQILTSIQSRSKDNLIALQRIREIMFHIRHYKILRNLLEANEEEYRSRTFSEFIMDPLRVLLLQIYDDLGDDELSDLHLYFFKCKMDVRGQPDEVDTHHLGKLWVFERLIRENLVSRTNLATLKGFMGDIRRKDIIKKIDTFTNDVDLHGPSHSGDSEITPPTNHHDLRYEEPSSCGNRGELLEEEPYLMRGPKTRGLCIVMNIKHFKNKMPTRIGSECDEIRVMELFQGLNFKVKYFYDMKRKKILSMLKFFGSKSDLKDFDILVFFAMSHGTKDHIYSADKKKVPISVIKKTFMPSQCQTLEGKPKLFFIQACQGKQESVAKPKYNIRDSKMRRDGPSDEREIEDTHDHIDGPVHDRADFVIAIATVEDFVSYRSIINGTWFIQTLCDVVEKLASTSTIIDMLERVNHKVGERKGSYGQKQMSEYRSTLRYPCFLTYEAYQRRKQAK